MSTPSLNNLKGRLTALVLADRRQAALLAFLLVAGVVLVVQRVSRDATPARASAAVTPLRSAAAPDLQAEMQSRLLAAERRREDYLLKIDRQVARDMFRVQYPAYPPKGPAAPEAPLMKGWLEKAQELLAATAKQAADDKQAQTDAVHARAQALRLQSTMLAGKPSAIINGQVVSVGETFSGFLIRRVGEGQCVVAQGDVEVTLKIE